MKRKVISITIILAMIFTMLSLTGCGDGSFKQGKALFEQYDDKNIQKINVVEPKSIEVFSSVLGCGYTYTSEEKPEEFRALVDGFCSLIVEKEMTPPESDDVFQIYFTWDDESTTYFEMCDGHAATYGKKTDRVTYYKLEYGKEYQDIMRNCLYKEFGKPVAYKTIYDGNGIHLELGEYGLDESGNFKIEIVGDNTSDKDVCYKLNTTVNGFPIHSYQMLGLMKDSNAVGYYISIPTMVLKEFGIEVIGEVAFTVDIFEDLGTIDTGELVGAIDQPIVLKTEDYANMDTQVKTGDMLCESNGVSIYGTRIEMELYTALGMYYKNDSNEDVVVNFKSIDLDGEPLGMGGADEVFSVNVMSHGEKFAFVPLYNYEWNQETNVSTKVDIEEISVSFTVRTDKESHSTSKAVVE